jgi:hypothetical protein
MLPTPDVDQHIAKRPLLKRPVFWAIVGGIVAMSVFGVMFTAVVPLSSDTLRERVVRSLSEKLDSDVELGDVHLHLFPGLKADGSNLTIRRHGRTDIPPLISIARFSVSASVAGLRHKHVDRVELSGLDIEIPPHSKRDDDAGASAPQDQSHDGKGDDHGTMAGDVVIDTLVSADAKLAIIPDEANRPPKVWSIHRLTMHAVSANQAMPFTATLTNAIPPGEIETEGSFGPWHNGDEGLTPLNGSFYFAKADLSVFNGIAGTLSSEGYFDGALNSIHATGTTDTPDFLIKVGGHPFPLHVAYESLIDGTNGDTRLPVMDAWFLSSYLHASGAVLGAPQGKDGRTVTLDVDMSNARIEDIMTMAVKTPKPPMTGALTLKTKFVLPPGHADVVDRLRLNGRFSIDTASFTSLDVQSTLNQLSKRASAKTADPQTARVVSDFAGRFILADGRLRLPELTFAVPGAKVELAGAYGLKPETLDFKGRLLLDAKISQTVTGFKSVMLKVVDPFFRQKDGTGSEIPIKIVGTRSNPDFGLDVHRVFHRDNTP